MYIYINNHSKNVEKVKPMFKNDNKERYNPVKLHNQKERLF